MHDDLALKLPIAEINTRLTRLARERDRLRALLKIAVEARDDAAKFGCAATHDPQPATASRGGAG